MCNLYQNKCYFAGGWFGRIPVEMLFFEIKVNEYICHGHGPWTFFFCDNTLVIQHGNSWKFHANAQKVRSMISQQKLHLSMGFQIVTMDYQRVTSNFHLCPQVAGQPPWQLTRCITILMAPVSDGYIAMDGWWHRNFMGFEWDFYNWSLNEMLNRIQ